VYKNVYIYILLSLVFFKKTVAIFSATYTLQQLGRSLRNKQKNEKTSYRIRLVTSVSLLSTLPCTPNFAPIPALQKYTCIWNTSFVPRHFKYKAHSDIHNTWVESLLNDTWIMYTDGSCSSEGEIRAY
jgi:hypothetical protein